MRKVDFTVDAPEGQVFADVAVGQQLQLVQQEDQSWACARQQDGSVVCRVPADAAAALRGCAAPPVATVRSVKRSQADAAAAVSMQVRIAMPSEAGALAWNATQVELRSLLVGGHSGPRRAQVLRLRPLPAARPPCRHAEQQQQQPLQQAPQRQPSGHASSRTAACRRLQMTPSP